MPEPAMPEPIDIEVNGEIRSVRIGFSIEDLLASLAIERSRIAVELNRSILPPDQYDTRLAAGDRLEIVSFVGGG